MLNEKKNMIIVFHSLTQCITEYTAIKENIKIELIKYFANEEKNLEKQNNELFNKILENDKENKENNNEEENKLLFIIKNSLLFKIV